MPDSSPGVPLRVYAASNKGLFDAGWKDRLVGIVHERLHLLASTTLTGFETAEELVQAALCDPIRVFIKDEPHKEAKLRDKRYRLIFSISLTDQVVERVLYSVQDKASIANWRTVQQKPGMPLNQEGGDALRQQLAGLALRTGMVDNDCSGWDMSYQYLDQALVTHTRCLQYGVKPEIFSLTGPTPLAQAIITRGYASMLSVICFSDGAMIAQEEVGIQKSGKFVTGSDNSRARYVNARLIGSAWCVSMGDDAIEDGRLWPQKREYYSLLGKNLKEYHEATPAQFEFCSNRFITVNDNTVLVPSNWLKMLCQLLNKTGNARQKSELLSQFQMDLANSPYFELALAVVRATRWQHRVEGPQSSTALELQISSSNSNTDPTLMPKKLNKKKAIKKMAKKVKGKTLVKEMVPAAYAGRGTTRHLTYRSGSKPGSLVVSGRDFMQTVSIPPSSAVGTTIVDGKLQPSGWEPSRLNAFATIFEKYHFRRARLTFEPSVPTTFQGAIMMYWDKDPIDAEIYGEDALRVGMAHGGVQNPAYVPNSVSWADSDPAAGYYTGQAGTDPADSRQAIQGAFKVILAAAPVDDNAYDIGLLFMDYEVEFFDPSLDVTDGNAASAVFYGTSDYTVATAGSSRPIPLPFVATADGTYQGGPYAVRTLSNIDFPTAMPSLVMPPGYHYVSYDQSVGERTASRSIVANTNPQSYMVQYGHTDSYIDPPTAIAVDNSAGAEADATNDQFTFSNALWVYLEEAAQLFWAPATVDSAGGTNNALEIAARIMASPITQAAFEAAFSLFAAEPAAIRKGNTLYLDKNTFARAVTMCPKKKKVKSSKYEAQLSLVSPAAAAAAASPAPVVENLRAISSASLRR